MPTRNFDGIRDSLARPQCMRECRSFPCSSMLDLNGFDPSTEQRLLLFQHT
jgi:hypothetical protein